MKTLYSHQSELSYSRSMQERLHWIERRYELLAGEILGANSEESYLGKRTDGGCRYCGKVPPHSEFKRRSHAFPELTGNKWLIDLAECDVCNKHFSSKVDDHFGKWTLPWRTMGRHEGKKGMPDYQTRDQSISIKPKDRQQIEIYLEKADTRITHYENAKLFTISLKRPAYIPAAVFKCLVKMAVAVMPEGENTKCAHLKPWLLEEEHTTDSFSKDTIQISHELAPGPLPNDRIGYALFRRKQGREARCPYMLFALQMGNHIFQITLPMPAEDSLLTGTKRMNTQIWPHFGSQPALREKYGTSTCETFDMSSSSVLEGDTVLMTFNFADSVEPTASPDE